LRDFHLLNESNQNNKMKSTTWILLCSASKAFANPSTTTHESSPTINKPSPTIDVFLPYDRQLLFASVSGVNEAATTMVIRCPPNADSNDCGFGTGAITMTQQGTTSNDATINIHSDITMIMHCSYKVSSGGQCAKTVTSLGVDISFPSGGNTQAPSTVLATSTMTESYAASEVTLMPVTVTAGRAKLATALISETSWIQVAPTKSSNAAATGLGMKAFEIGVAGLFAAML
jgi:hypothetical protein